MIVTFSVSNFRSFSSEETFSLVASNRLSGSHEEHVFPIPHSDEKVLKIGVLYGANGAGKSNLFKALSYLMTVALNRRTLGTEREAFRLHGLGDELSGFDLQFIARDKLYRFGFEADDTRIAKEWLTEVIGGRERIIYERSTDSQGMVTVHAPDLKKCSEKLAALVTIGGPRNQSFLATVNVTLESADHGDDLGAVILWFKQSLRLVAPDSRFARLGSFLAENPECTDFAGAFLKTVSTGVDHLEVSKKEITKEELRSLLPEDAVSRFLNQLAASEKDQVGIVSLDDGVELMLEKARQDRFFLVTTRLGHKSGREETVSFDMNMESDGTRRLLNLMPALHGLQTNDEVYFIDEIDRSLHPNLVWEFVNFFLKGSKAGRAQLILTTHESNLLDLDLLRRDEIWFAEKDAASATRLYSLSDFKVRKDLEIRKHYLNGRFGAVPFLGDLERLLPESIPT